MKILEDLPGWIAAYEAGWLAHLRETGKTDFKIYNRPRNNTAPAGPGVDLARSRLVLITTAGSYLLDSQPPFDDGDPLGDYTLRTYPSDTSLDALAFAQEHYDHAAVLADPQVLVPLEHLRNMEAEGRIGKLAKEVISVHGYMPDVARLIAETIPAVVQATHALEAEATLLVPA